MQLTRTSCSKSLLPHFVYILLTQQLNSFILKLMCNYNRYVYGANGDNTFDLFFVRTYKIFSKTCFLTSILIFILSIFLLACNNWNRNRDTFVRSIDNLNNFYFFSFFVHEQWYCFVKTLSTTKWMKMIIIEPKLWIDDKIANERMVLYLRNKFR